MQNLRSSSCLLLQILHKIFMPHNIIQIHNSVLWDWQYSVEYAPHSDWMWGILHTILLVPQNIVMDLNNVMHSFWFNQLYFTIFPYFYLKMWRAMDTSHYNSMRPLKHFLTYKCRSPKDWRLVYGGKGGFNQEEEVSRWVRIWENESS
jgi:hypothetical protein